MQYTNTELEKVRSELPRGSAKVIGEKTGLAAGTVRNVLSGLSNNDQVILAALEIIAEAKKKVESTKKSIAAL